MFEKIDINRRKILKFGLLSSFSFLISGRVFADTADEISQITDMSQDTKISLRIWPSLVYTRVTIESLQKLKIKYFILDNPKRLVIDIYEIALDSVKNDISLDKITDDRIVRGIKLGQFTAQVTRVVLYLKEAIKIQVQNCDPIDLEGVSYNYRFMLDMYHMGINSDSGNIEDDDLLSLLDALDENELSKRRASHAIISPSPVSRNNKAKNKGKILITLDPGHGGEDPGAIGHGKTREKVVVLDMAKMLYEMINQSDFMVAKMTRTQDIFIPLTTRVNLAHRSHSDLFVSIHADAFTSPVPHGSTVFVLSDKGASSSFAKFLADSQNNADRIGGVPVSRGNATLNGVLLDMTQTWTRRNSNRFGDVLLSHLGEVHQLHSKRVETAGFAVLKAPDIPSALVETAFISNKEEEALLNTMEFREKIVKALHKGVVAFAKSMLNDLA